MRGLNDVGKASESFGVLGMYHMATFILVHFLDLYVLLRVLDKVFLDVILSNSLSVHHVIVTWHDHPKLNVAGCFLLIFVDLIWTLFIDVIILCRCLLVNVGWVNYPNVSVASKWYARTWVVDHNSVWLHYWVLVQVGCTNLIHRSHSHLLLDPSSLCTSVSDL